MGRVRNRQFQARPEFLGHRGFSLVATLISGAIMAMIALAIGEAVSSFFKSGKSLTQLQDFNALILNPLIQVVRSPEQCTTVLGGGPSGGGKELFRTTSPPLPSPGSIDLIPALVIGSQTVTKGTNFGSFVVTNLSFQDVSQQLMPDSAAPSTNTFSANLVVEATYNRIVGNGTRQGSSSRIEKIFFSAHAIPNPADPSSFVITDCNTQVDATQEFCQEIGGVWRKDLSPPTCQQLGVARSLPNGTGGPYQGPGILISNLQVNSGSGGSTATCQTQVYTSSGAHEQGGDEHSNGISTMAAVAVSRQSTASVSYYVPGDCTVVNYFISTGGTTVGGP